METGTASSVAAALLTRQSVRAYLARPVAEADVREVLRLASYAASGSNMQPWRVLVLGGATLAAVSAGLEGAYRAGEKGGREYRYYPEAFPEPYLARRRACGFGLYGAMGIARGDAAAMQAQRAENYRFFGAPVGLVLTIDRRLELGSWIDMGSFLTGVMLAARGLGLHSCAEASIAEYPAVLRTLLPIEAEHKVVCGMALGYADPAATVNSFRTERAGVDDFTTFLD